MRKLRHLLPLTCCSSVIITSTAIFKMPNFVCGLSDFRCVLHIRPSSFSASLISRIRILYYDVKRHSINQIGIQFRQTNDYKIYAWFRIRTCATLKQILKYNQINEKSSPIYFIFPNKFIKEMFNGMCCTFLEHYLLAVFLFLFGLLLQVLHPHHLRLSSCAIFDLIRICFFLFFVLFIFFF